MTLWIQWQHVENYTICQVKKEKPGWILTTSCLCKRRRRWCCWWAVNTETVLLVDCEPGDGDVIGELMLCVQMLLFDFTHHNIEMACSLLESCGRYLYRTVDSHQRVKVYLVSAYYTRNICHLSHLSLLRNKSIFLPDNLCIDRSVCISLLCCTNPAIGCQNALHATMSDRTLHW